MNGTVAAADAAAGWTERRRRARPPKEYSVINTLSRMKVNFSWLWLCLVVMLQLPYCRGRDYFKENMQ